MRVISCSPASSLDRSAIRFRLLDPQLRTRLGLTVDDLAVPLSQFHKLDGSGLSTLITENRMTPMPIVQMMK